jgi:hypothetical protein
MKDKAPDNVPDNEIGNIEFTCSGKGCTGRCRVIQFFGTRTQRLALIAVLLGSQLNPNPCPENLKRFAKWYKIIEEGGYVDGNGIFIKELICPPSVGGALIKGSPVSGYGGRLEGGNGSRKRHKEAWHYGNYDMRDFLCQLNKIKNGAPISREEMKDAEQKIRKTDTKLAQSFDDVIPFINLVRQNGIALWSGKPSDVIAYKVPADCIKNEILNKCPPHFCLFNNGLYFLLGGNKDYIGQGNVYDRVSAHKNANRDFTYFVGLTIRNGLDNTWRSYLEHYWIEKAKETPGVFVSNIQTPAMPSIDDADRYAVQQYIKLTTPLLAIITCGHPLFS